MSDDQDRTASLMTPAKLAQLKVRPTPAASPAAWLDQLAADAGSGHIRRLLDLRGQLAPQLGDTGSAGLRNAASALAGALEQVDFALLQPKGWLARATGKAKDAIAGFAAQLERCQRAADDLVDEVHSVQRRQATQGAAVDRTVLEFDVEVRSIEKIMDQGARWLQDMRNQLKAREATGGDAATLQKIQEDTRRCELLVARLKNLRTASSASQQVVEQGRGAAARRTALLQALHGVIDNDWKAAQRQLAALAEQAKATGAASEGVEPARELCVRIAAALRGTAADAGALQSQERALLESLEAVQQPLQAAA